MQFFKIDDVISDDGQPAESQFVASPGARVGDAPDVHDMRRVHRHAAPGFPLRESNSKRGATVTRILYSPAPYSL